MTTPTWKPLPSYPSVRRHLYTSHFVRDGVMYWRVLLAEDSPHPDHPEIAVSSREGWVTDTRYYTFDLNTYRDHFNDMAALAYADEHDLIITSCERMGGDSGTNIYSYRVYTRAEAIIRGFAIFGRHQGPKDGEVQSPCLSLDAKTIRF